MGRVRGAVIGLPARRTSLSVALECARRSTSADDDDARERVSNAHRTRSKRVKKRAITHEKRADPTFEEDFFWCCVRALFACRIAVAARTSARINHGA